jgi:hypothetical protein
MVESLFLVDKHQSLVFAVDVMLALEGREGAVLRFIVLKGDI